MRLHGRTALVTGASQGLGKAIALRFAREGATVVLAARSAERLAETAAEIEAAGGRALAVPTDLRDPASIDALARRVETEVGGIDVLVAGSGITGPTAELWKVSLDEWEETIRVNLTGTFLTCRALLPAMVRRRAGSVIVIGSTSGKRPLFGRTPYAASKLGLVGLVRTLAAELGPHGVRVNLISPGAVAGPRIEAVIQAQADAAGTTYEATLAQYAAETPLRAVRPARGRGRRGRVPRLGRLRLDHRRGPERLRRPRDVLTTKQEERRESGPQPDGTGRRPPHARNARGVARRARGAAYRRGDRARPAPVRAAAPPRCGWAARWRAGRAAWPGVSARSARELGRIAAGSSDIAPRKGDRRFGDRAWNDSWVFHRLMQAYLAAGGTVAGLVDDAALDWRTDLQDPVRAGQPARRARPDELHAHQPAGAQGDDRSRWREPRHGRAAVRRRRRPRPTAGDGRHQRLPGRPQPRRQRGLGRPAHRRVRAHPLQADDRGGLRDAAAGRAADDQQVLRHGPRARTQPDRAPGRPGPPGLLHLLAQPRRRARATSTSTPTRRRSRGPRRGRRDRAPRRGQRAGGLLGRDHHRRAARPSRRAKAGSARSRA